MLEKQIVVKSAIADVIAHQLSITRAVQVLENGVVIAETPLGTTVYRAFEKQNLILDFGADASKYLHLIEWVEPDNTVVDSSPI